MIAQWHSRHLVKSVHLELLTVEASAMAGNVLSTNGGLGPQGSLQVDAGSEPLPQQSLSKSSCIGKQGPHRGVAVVHWCRDFAREICTLFLWERPKFHLWMNSSRIGRYAEDFPRMKTPHRSSVSLADVGKKLCWCIPAIQISCGGPDRSL